MDEVDHLNEDEERAMLLLTYSGSLLSLGCGKVRSMEYASIKLRGDVPDIIKSEKVELTSSLDKGSAAYMKDDKELTVGQKKLDKNGNGKIDGEDFSMMK